MFLLNMKIAVLRIRIRLGSGFKSVPGSGFGIRIRIVNFSCFKAFKSHKILKIQ
jgi:hypothetical protein